MSARVRVVKASKHVQIRLGMADDRVKLKRVRPYNATALVFIAM